MTYKTVQEMVHEIYSEGKVIEVEKSGLRNLIVTYNNREVHYFHFIDKVNRDKAFKEVEQV